jgi:hypothetical protein
MANVAIPNRFYTMLCIRHFHFHYIVLHEKHQNDTNLADKENQKHANGQVRSMVDVVTDKYVSLGVGASSSTNRESKKKKHTDMRRTHAATYSPLETMKNMLWLSELVIVAMIHIKTKGKL